MKKIITAIVLSSIALTSVPAMSREYHGQYRESHYRPPNYPYNRGWTPPPPYRDDRYRDYRHHHDDNDAAEVLVPLIGGVIIGAIIAGSQNDNRDRRPDPREYRYDSRCDCYRR